jgi:hypothetical protein
VTDGQFDEVEARDAAGGNISLERLGMALSLRSERAGLLRFELEAATGVTMFLWADGRLAPVERIGVGPSARAPERNPISFQRKRAGEAGARHDHPKGEHHHHEHTHPHDSSDHHHHAHEHPHPVTHGHHPH